MYINNCNKIILGGILDLYETSRAVFLKNTSRGSGLDSYICRSFAQTKILLRVHLSSLNV